jgi:hypothetical protein
MTWKSKSSELQIQPSKSEKMGMGIDKLAQTAQRAAATFPLVPASLHSLSPQHPNAQQNQRHFSQEDADRPFFFGFQRFSTYPKSVLKRVSPTEQKYIL